MKVLKPARLKKDLENGCYQFRVFHRHGATGAFSSRRFRMDFCPGGNRSVVVAHRKHFCDLAGVPFETLVYLEQIHGANIVRVGMEEAGRGARDAHKALQGTDAVVTDTPRLTLSVHTADCAPIFFVDPTRRAIGMAHVGWRGAANRLVSKVVQAFRIHFLSKPADLVIAVGPMIRSCCYQVGAEFQEPFASSISKRSDSLYFDLFGWIMAELQLAGVGPQQVHDSGICTVCENDRFPSYRKEGSRVRHMLSVLAIHPL